MAPFCIYMQLIEFMSLSASREKKERQLWQQQQIQAVERISVLGINREKRNKVHTEDNGGRA